MPYDATNPHPAFTAANRTRHPRTGRASPGKSRPRSAACLLALGLIATPPAIAADPPHPPRAGQVPAKEASTPWINWHFGPDSRDDWGLFFFGGRYVNNSMTSIFLEDYIPPWDWDYGTGAIVGLALSRKLVSLLDIIDVEPELGMAQRLGNQQEQEFWGAFYFRYHRFPWNDYLYTTIAISTGLNYATGISDEEKRRAGPNSDGSRWLHYLGPEVTFALPQHRETELVFRFHHRSGGYGLVSDADGGSHYATVGLRFRF